MVLRQTWKSSPYRRLSIIFSTSSSDPSQMAWRAVVGAVLAHIKHVGGNDLYICTVLVPIIPNENITVQVCCSSVCMGGAADDSSQGVSPAYLISASTAALYLLFAAQSSRRSMIKKQLFATSYPAPS